MQSSLCIICRVHGRRKVWKSGERVRCNMLGIICPHLIWKVLTYCQIQLYKNIARCNLIGTKYHQMASQSLSDSTLISPIQRSFETPGQTKVGGNRQREATHEVCCYTSQFLGRGDPPPPPGPPVPGSDGPDMCSGSSMCTATG